MNGFGSNPAYTHNQQECANVQGFGAILVHVKLFPVSVNRDCIAIQKLSVHYTPFMSFFVFRVW